MYRTIVEAVLNHGQKIPEKLAVGFKNIHLTYNQLVQQIKKCACLLKTEYSIEAGDMIMLSAVSRPDYVVLLLGIQYLGAISVPLDKSAKMDNVIDICNFVQPKLLITDIVIEGTNIRKTSLKKIYGEILEGELLPAEEPEYTIPPEHNVAEILFTTGTTGAPKGAMLTYGNLYASTHNTWHGVNMVSEDIVLIPLPLNHSVGMRVLRTALYTGASVVIQNGFTFAKELETNINSFHCSALVSVPASIELVYRQMKDKFAEILGKLRYIEFGAGSLSYDMKRKLTALLPHTTIYNTWGSTETGGAIFLNVTSCPDKLTSLGKAVDGIALKTVDVNGNEIQSRDINTAGRMLLQGSMVMAGYYKLPEITAQTLVDGWLYTNDIVYTDKDGYVYMLGRIDDIINVGGEKVSPIEVENISQEFPQIRECACIGVEDPDKVLGQIPILYVVLEESEFKQNELVKFLSERMEKYKLPHKYIVIDELPKNRMQKLDRKKLYQLWQDNGETELMNDTVRTIFSRQSIRDFSEMPVSRAKLEMLVKAGIHAPSGHNMQTWKFTVIQNKEKIAALKQCIKVSAERNKVYFYGFHNPNTIILISNDRRNENSIQDSACAAENIMLAAHSYGIGSVWINALKTLCDEPEIRQLLTKYGIPKQHIVWATLALGYPEKQTASPARKLNVVEWLP